MYDIERYLNIQSAYGASLSSSGTLAFLMDTTGTPQVWTLEAAGAWPEQRTFFDESVSYCTWSPEREELVFGMDEGGNERLQLFRLDTVGERAGEVTPLTGMPDAKHTWGGWDSTGDRFAFASNRRDEGVFDVYVQGRDETGEAARMVHEGDGWYGSSGFSPDDSRLIVTQAHALLDQDVHVLDLASGELDHLTPHEGTARFQSASWGPDGEYIYLVTDHGADLRYLARLSLAGDLERVDLGIDEGETDREWNVTGIALNEETGRIVFALNVDGYTELFVGDVDGTTVRGTRRLDLPHGVAGGISFSDDARRGALTVTTRTQNTNVHVVDFDTNESVQWTHAPTAGIPEESFVAPDLVHYETFDGREIPAFFSLPHGIGEGEGDERVPVIVDIHGGPESQRRPSFSALTQYYLANGYAVFEPNVRGSTGYGTAYSHLDDVEKRMDSVRDIRAAVEWLTDHPAVDPDRIVAYGASYGGFMVLASVTEYPELWAAAVDIVGIANFVTFLENTGEWRRSLREAEYGSLADDREFLESISPINNVETIQAPLFVLHGANDPRVPVDEAEQIADEAAAHVPVEKLVFDDEGHGISKRENRIEAYGRIVRFLDQHV